MENTSELKLRYSVLLIPSVYTSDKVSVSCVKEIGGNQGTDKYVRFRSADKLASVKVSFGLRQVMRD